MSTFSSIICTVRCIYSYLHRTLQNTKHFFTQKALESFISPEISISFLINSDSNLTQTQTLNLKLTPNSIQTQTLLLTLKKANKNSANCINFVLVSLILVFLRSNLSELRNTVKSSKLSVKFLVN